MVPLSEKRHRIESHEIKEIIQGLIPRLEQLAEREKEKARIAFRTLYRLIFEGKGRPKYPEFTWSDAYALASIYKDES